MNKELAMQRYHYPVRKQFKNLALLVVLGVATFVYGSSMQDPAVGMYFIVLSGIYPLIILLNVFQNVRSWNYTDVDIDGIHTTHLGLFHKHIRWTDIESLAPISIAGAEGVGINLREPHKHRSLATRFNAKNFGYEQAIRQGYSVSGQSLSDAANDYLAKPGGRRGAAKAKVGEQITEAAPVTIKRSFLFSDMWTRPNTLAWFGASIICNMLGGMLRQDHYALSNVFVVLGLVTLGFAATSMMRYRRVVQAGKNKTKTPKSNDWLT